MLEAFKWFSEKNLIGLPWFTRPYLTWPQAPGTSSLILQPWESPFCSSQASQASTRGLCTGVSSAWKPWPCSPLTPIQASTHIPHAGEGSSHSSISKCTLHFLAPDSAFYFLLALIITWKYIIWRHIYLLHCFYLLLFANPTKLPESKDFVSFTKSLAPTGKSSANKYLLKKIKEWLWFLFPAPYF